MTIFSIIKAIRRDGLRYSLVRAFAIILRQDLDIERAKKKALKILKDKHKLVVAHGIFKGMKLNDQVFWSRNDLITQTLGTYEDHIVKKLINFNKKGFTRFVDIGAADGYFCTGFALSNLYKNIIAFEIDKFAQKKIYENAFNNNCHKLITIYGEANYTSLSKILSDEQKTSILIDIEGSEFKLLDDKMLYLLSDCSIIIELHPFLVDDGDKLEKDLISRSSKYFEYEIIKRENYNPNIFDELDNLSDEERLIALGEGRGKNMNWLVLYPKKIV